VNIRRVLLDVDKAIQRPEIVDIALHVPWSGAIGLDAGAGWAQTAGENC
jgi:hypothetical protein